MKRCSCPLFSVAAVSFRVQAQLAASRHDQTRVRNQDRQIAPSPFGVVKAQNPNWLVESMHVRQHASFVGDGHQLSPVGKINLHIGPAAILKVQL